MMDEGKIVLIGNESDILHCGYGHSISEGGKRYPSIIHFTHSQILTQLGVDENVILELLSTPSCGVPIKAKQLLRDNMPTGHDLSTLASYLEKSWQSYTMSGLRLRVFQDPAFAKTLMNTKEALLIVCDKHDKDIGIGMDEGQFVDWMQREKADYQMLSYWMRNDQHKPALLGSNQLGFLLMWLRYQQKEEQRRTMLHKLPVEVDGISFESDNKKVKMQISDLVISLQGIFRPLSNYYPLHFDMKGDRYRSVEHYAYVKLFDSLKLDDKMVEKLATTALPEDVPIVAQRIFDKLEISSETIESKKSKMDRWRQSAMKHKITQFDYLQQLLLATGNAILIDCAAGEYLWTCGGSENEMQHLLTKSYVTPATLIDWMREDAPKTPTNVTHLKGNKIGFLLMELRCKFASSTADRIPLVSPLKTTFPLISPNVVCFTAESVWHPLYPAEIRVDQTLLPSPAHYVAQQAAKYLAFNTEDTEYVVSCKSSLECWERLHNVIETKSHELEREQSWWMEKRQKAIKDSLQLLLEQHPPLLRALLDTGDSLLVYCARFSSVECELSIGMRESDLRTWMHAVDITSKQLFDMCTHPLAFRPSYLGGNRLGLILMELRREFILRGVFPTTLPELPISVDTILGTDSPTETMTISENFDILNPENYASLWINPLLLVAKGKIDSALLSVATMKKAAPRLVTVDDTKIETIIDALTIVKGKVDCTELSKVDAEDLRAVFMRLCLRLRQRIGDVERHQLGMNNLANEITKLQMMRRGLEETRDRTVDRVAGGRDREELSRERDRSSPVRKIDREYKVSIRKRSPDGHRHIKREYTYDRKPNFEPRVARSPPRKKEKIESPVTKIAKVPRPANDELSDGEILSSDEDQ